MANPQKEHGYIPIANELAKAIAKHDFGCGKGQIFWAIISKTYGWNKKKDSISVSQIQKMTGLSRRSVIYNLQILECQNKITIDRNHDINIISIQKDYMKWNDDNLPNNYLKLKEGAKKRSSAKHRKKVVQKSVKILPSFAPTKDTITKDNIQKTKEQHPSDAFLKENCGKPVNNSEKFVAITREITSYGFNICMLINKFKKNQKERKALYEIPEEVFINTCYYILTDLKMERKIDRHFPYFMRILEQKVSEYFANTNIRESLQYKKRSSAMKDVVNEIVQKVAHE